jgi:hypothetical protein
MGVALANSRGLLDYEKRVSTYWPEFVQHGKDKVTESGRAPRGRC